jgi:SpoIID/LytB domain protein
VQAYYSASCGGHSEHNEHIWGTPADPTLRGKLDALGAGAKKLAAFKAGVTDDTIADFLATPADAAFCGKTKYAKGRYRWTVRKSADELDRLVAADYPQVGEVKALTPRERGVSGRVRSLEIEGSKGKVTVDGDLKIRRLFGGLKSTLFQVSRAKGEWVFEGAGFGHGVGMCQTGAIGMAEAGYKYSKILEHYYPGSKIVRLY